MKALISPNETVKLPDGGTGQRVAEVAAIEFPVAKPLHWLDCDDDVKADTYYFDGTDLVPLPPPPPPVAAAAPEPIADGGPRVVAQ